MTTETEILNEQDIKHILNCQFAEWYKLFKADTPKTRVVACPEEFREWLLADGMVLPDNGELSDSDSVASSSDDDNDEPAVVIPASFDYFIRETIKQLDGQVAPKLNWSAPRDAVWISPTNNMRCINPNDVYMLIKSSDYCTFDLTKSLGDRGPKQLTLVLREWFDIHPSLEFRCFVKNGELVGISQRDLNYYDFLEPLRAKLEDLLSQFAKKLAAKFPDPSFVFDAYIPKSYDKVWLIDINPWLTRTDTLLFDWDELNAWDKPLELRLLDKLDSTRGFSAKQHTTNYVPHDLVDMPREDVEELVEKMRESYREQQKE